ncbi:MAG: Ig-like domain-containing protein [Solobacterium sp.]|nr:Ig-like domain-containing protein [Solobacterium sp.]
MLPVHVHAEEETFGDFRYTVSDGEVTITGYDGQGPEVVVPNEINGQPVTVIGPYAFNSIYSSRIYSITLPEHLKRIEEAAFSMCIITSLTIPEGCVSIGKWPFYDCTQLRNLKIPSTVSEIHPEAFRACSSFSSITVNENSNWYSSEDGVLFNKDKTELIKYPTSNNRQKYTVPATVQILRSYSFEHAVSIRELVLPVSVKRIEDYAYTDPYSNLIVNYRGTKTQWSEVTIGEGVRFDQVDFVDVFNNHFSVTTKPFGVVHPHDNVTFRTEVSGDDLTGVTYEWFRGWDVETRVKLPETGSSLYVEDIRDIVRYVCVAHDRYGSTSECVFHVFPKNDLKAVLVSERDQLVHYGEPADIIVKAEGYDTEGLTYEWKEFANHKERQLSGGQNGILHIDAVQYNASYYCTIRDRFDSVATEYCSITVDNELKIEAVTPEQFRVHPGDPAVLKAKASAIDETGFEYGWGYVIYTPRQGFAGIECHTDTLVVDAVNEERTYMCFVTDRFGNTDGVSFEVLFYDPIESITLDIGETKLVSGEPLQIHASVLPDTADADSVVWTSSDESIAEVDAHGNVTGHKKGTVTITAADPEGKVSASCTVDVSRSYYTELAPKAESSDDTVPDEVIENISSETDHGVQEAMEISADAVEIPDEVFDSLDPDEKIVVQVQLEVTASEYKTEDDMASIVLDITPTYKAVKMSKSEDNQSEGEEIGYSGELMITEPVEISLPIADLFPGDTAVWIHHRKEDGTVYTYRAVKDGEYIRFTNPDGFSSFEFYEVPFVHVQDIRLSEETLTLHKDETHTLHAVIEPENADDPTVEWSSSDESVVSVDSEGNLKANKSGTAEITVRTADGGHTASCTVTVINPLQRIELSKELVLEKGITEKLSVSVYPEDADDRSIVWSSSDPSVASVNENGEVTGNEIGTAVITALNEATGVSAECRVTVTIFTNRILVEPDSVTLEKGDQAVLKATVLPNNALDKTYIWKSEDESIAKVDEDGTVTAVKSGTTVIRAEANDGHSFGTCTVTVVTTVTGIKLEQEAMTLRVGTSETLQVSVLPEDADNKNVTWSSSDPSAVTVDQNGRVTAVADHGIEEPSQAVITVTTKDGGYTASCTVTVEDPINAFVRRLYLLCFGRKAEEEGLNTWTTVLKNRSFTAAQVVVGFFLSKEMKALDLTPKEFVERCYLVMMDREGEEEGMKTWMDCLDAGMSELFILSGFVGSGEFKQICADTGIEVGKIVPTEARDRNYGITAFVSRCYTEVLERTAEAEGLNTWCGYIFKDANRKKNAIWVASNGFFHSPEYVNKHTGNEQYIRTLYRTFLGREAEDAGYKFWADQMTKGMSRDQVMSGFSNSNEFNKIMESYGIR